MLMQELFNIFLSAGTKACDGCAGSAFSSVTAAFATMGYYAQASWLTQIYGFGMHNWAILLYVITAIGFIVSIAMGIPAKMYLWLCVGPGLFYWLTENRVGVTGVQWRVGDHVRPMSEVWRLAEVGLANDYFIQANGYEVSASKPPKGETICGSGACVSNFFAWFDRLISDTVSQLIALVGVTRVGGGGTFDIKDTNISTLGAETTDGRWDLTAPLRWEFFQSITNAQLRNPDIKHAFATFMAGECGDALINSVDKTALMSSSNKQRSALLNTFFLKASPSSQLAYLPVYQIWGNLALRQVPTPDSVKRLLSGGRQAGGAYDSAKDQNTVGRESKISKFVEFAGEDIFRNINCRTYFLIVMQGFLWETMHQSYHVLNNSPAEDMGGFEYALHMFYGWDIKQVDINTGKVIKQEGDLIKFTAGLVLSNLFKNELVIAPGELIEKKFTSGEQTIKNVGDFQRVNNQRAKYGELYTWAMMIPYFQGQLLYFLAIAYPFACMMILMPGMHRALFTWMQTWIWLKMWDLGFAVVMVLERTVWAMTSQNTLGPDVHSTVVSIADRLRISGAEDGMRMTPYLPKKDHFIPIVDIPLYDGSGGDVYGFVLDKLLGLTGQMQLDLVNSYYIYIMSALYFAVPVVTGSVALGAKSHLAQLVSSSIGQIAQPAGNAAGSAAVGEMQGRMSAAQAIGRQEAYAKSLRGSGIMGQALGAANQGLMSGVQAQAAYQRQGLVGGAMQAVGDTLQSRNSALGFYGQVMPYYNPGGGAGETEAQRQQRLAREAAAQQGLGGAGGGQAGPPGGPGGPRAGDSGSGGSGNSVAPFVPETPKERFMRFFDAGLSGQLAGQFSNAWQKDDATQAYLAQTNQLLRPMQLDAGIDSFVAQSASQRMNMYGSRLEQQANQFAEQKSWEAANAYNESSTGRSEFFSAIGGMSGSLTAGHLATSTQAFAGSGRAGDDASRAFHAPSNGGSISAFTNNQTGGFWQDRESVRGLYKQDDRFSFNNVATHVVPMAAGYAAKEVSTIIQNKGKVIKDPNSPQTGK